MFIVANLSHSEIVISDLKLSIPPKQSRDLHALKLPIDPDRSKDLGESLRKGYLKIVKKDVPVAAVQPEKEVIVKEVIREVPKETLDQEKLISAIREEVQKQLKMVQVQSSPSNDILGQILAKVNSLASVGPSGVTIKEEQLDPDNQVDQELLKIIHSKAVDKIVKNVQGSVELEQKQETDTSISSNISELEELI